VLPKALSLQDALETLRSVGGITSVKAVMIELPEGSIGHVAMSFEDATRLAHIVLMASRARAEAYLEELTPSPPHTPWCRSMFGPCNCEE